MLSQVWTVSNSSWVSLIFVGGPAKDCELVGTSMKLAYLIFDYEAWSLSQSSTILADDRH